LTVAGKLLALNNISLDILGNFQTTGIVDFTNSNIILTLSNVGNQIPYTGFLAGNSTVRYNAICDQPILHLAYNNLQTLGSIGCKYLTANTIIFGNLNAQSDFECLTYDLTVNGTSVIGTVGSYNFTKNGSGNLLFVGNVDFEGSTNLSGGNPNIEFRNGVQIHTFSFMSGTGNVYFTTNNQILNSSAYLGGIWNSPIFIIGDITVSLQGAFTTSSTIDGTTNSSTLNNNGTLNLRNSRPPMLTGIFNYMHDPNSTLGLLYDGSYTLPYSVYANLVVDGIGTKSQSANTIINKSLSIKRDFGESYYELNGYNLTVNGTLTNTGGFIANAHSNVLVVGLCTFSNGTVGSLGCDFRFGNPDFEFRGGLFIHAFSNYTGTGVFKFTTNNQTIDMNVINGGSMDCDILIDGITLTWIDGAIINTNYINGVINGTSFDSTLINKGIIGVANPQQPMLAGILNTYDFANTVLYIKDGAQDIKPGTYKNLTLAGSGTKKLLGNVVVKNTYTLTSSAILDLNGFTLSNS